MSSLVKFAGAGLPSAESVKTCCPPTSRPLTRAGGWMVLPS
jgi:hypothetical protein